MQKGAAKLIVECLEFENVEYVFGIPGAKVDAIFDALLDSRIKVILCRHEQNAAFMAAAYGRLTGKPGVVLVTSGPGVANLCTGLLTATTEGDPIVAIGGNVSLDMMHKESHQNTDNIGLMTPVTKMSSEITSVENIPEVISNAFRVAESAYSGACFISVPQNISTAVLNREYPCIRRPTLSCGRAKESDIASVFRVLAESKNPVLLLGQEASRDANAKAICEFVKKHRVPVVATYQGAGVIPKELLQYFYGRVGLFKNQPGDMLLEGADVVVSIGFNPVEYDPEIWNLNTNSSIIHIDYKPANIREAYQPKFELLGDIDENIRLLTAVCEINHHNDHPELRAQLNSTISAGSSKLGKPGTVHPLRFCYELSRIIDDETIVCCDIGTVYMWLARYVFTHNPRQLLFSNGQQTLGVGLPWAMAGKLAFPYKKVISISGDGGFLFSAMELETAVRENINIKHIVWTDGTYNMVKEQQLLKYNREAAVELGRVDIPMFAKSFGAEGYQVSSPEELTPLLEKEVGDKPVIIDVNIDYSDNEDLFISAIDPECIQ
ncbi:acetolactate synthase AlsS [Dongshaea marina]|uniref:acetolactate synthase AlsS n=1 Tax=Dongshaea marina TaxID=2047966 RepID=UPI000D3EE0EE|nr:acetolactate synthase AlsS [Dongshaea marina]